MNLSVYSVFMEKIKQVNLVRYKKQYCQQCGQDLIPEIVSVGGEKVWDGVSYEYDCECPPMGITTCKVS